MAAIIMQQSYVESRETLESYPQKRKNIYGMRDVKERVMGIININGCEYETDGKSVLKRRKKENGYHVEMHFSDSRDDVSSAVQMMLIDEFIKGINRHRKGEETK